MVKLCPAICTFPDRAAPEVLALTLIDTLPLPSPVLPAVIVAHGAQLTAAQGQAGRLVVTVSCGEPPAPATLAEGELKVYVQGVVGGGFTVTGTITETPLNAAVMCAVPPATAVTTPSELTVATLGVSEVQVIWGAVVRVCFDPSVIEPDMSSGSMSPTLKTIGEGAALSETGVEVGWTSRFTGGETAMGPPLLDGKAIAVMGYVPVGRVEGKVTLNETEDAAG